MTLIGTSYSYFCRMKNINISLVILLFVVFVNIGSTASAQSPQAAPPYQRNVSAELYNAIAQADSLFFNAYNNCNLAVIDSMISEDIEFYHDKGGLSTSKKQIMNATKENICGKVTRELLKGSIEVYEINNYGAVEIGFHGFHNNQEKETGPTHFSKFVHIWRLENNQWKLTRVISLH